MASVTAQIPHKVESEVVRVCAFVYSSREDGGKGLEGGRANTRTCYYTELWSVQLIILSHEQTFHCKSTQKKLVVSRRRATGRTKSALFAPSPANRERFSKRVENTANRSPRQAKNPFFREKLPKLSISPERRSPLLPDKISSRLVAAP